MEGSIEEVAQKMVDTMCSRRVCTTHPKVEKVFVAQEGNFTIVTLNGKYTGVAKFNPRDVKRLTVVEKINGICYETEVEKSKYSAVAGLKKAMHRAAVKMF